MKSRVLTILVAFALVVALFGFTAPVQAGAYGTAFVTSVTYVNVGSGEATINFNFYAAGSGTAIPITVPNLGMNAASSLYVGSLGELAPGFQGSGVISSSQPLAATLVQLPPAGSAVKNRPLSNGFTAGAPLVTIPTVLKATFSTNSIFTIQNVDGDAADLTVEFVPAGGGSIVTDTVSNLPAGSAKYYDMGTTPVISAGTFNGSVRVSAKKTGTITDGAVVASSIELSTATTNVYAFEGLFGGGTTVYMPSAFCQFGAGGAINSAFAVMNTDAFETASVTVTYAGGGSEPAVDVLPGAKQSFPGCGISGTVNTPGYIGSATITSVGANIVAVGKVGGNGLSTAYVGLTQGSEKVVLPYVRWTTAHWLDGTKQQVNIAIQNVGGAELAIGDVVVDFYDATGAKVGTISNPAAIPVGTKWSTNASSVNPEFGYVGTIGGAAIVTGAPGAQLAVIARAATYISAGVSAGEDYNGLPLP